MIEQYLKAVKSALNREPIYVYGWNNVKYTVETIAPTWPYMVTLVPLNDGWSLDMELNLDLETVLNFFWREDEHPCAHIMRIQAMADSMKVPKDA